MYSFIILFILVVLIYSNYPLAYKIINEQKIIRKQQSIYTYNFSILSLRNNFNKVIFFILSSVANFNKRYKIKKKWINLCLKLSCRYYFIIATKNNFDIIKNNCENDIIGIDIIDSYYNLTLLTSSIYRYCVLYNVQFDYAIKNDDDIYPNIPLIFIYINIYINKIKISGYFYPQMIVNRNKNSSVYLPSSIYPLSIFPSFVAGGFVITHHDLIPSIYYELMKEKKIIYREDMHLAVIYKKLNISFQNIQKYYHRKKKTITLKIRLNDMCFHGF